MTRAAYSASRRCRRIERRGAALVEVLIALVLLATAGTALITLLGQTSNTLRHLGDEERMTRLASGELDRLVLWDRSTALVHAGRFSVNGWTLTVQPLSAELFDVTVAASDTGAVLLRTTIYRPDTTHATSP